MRGFIMEITTVSGRYCRLPNLSVSKHFSSKDLQEVSQHDCEVDQKHYLIVQISKLSYREVSDFLGITASQHQILQEFQLSSPCSRTYTNAFQLRGQRVWEPLLLSRNTVCEVSKGNCLHSTAYFDCKLIISGTIFFFCVL
ncbi:unnamed protein product [Lepidochelys kempii]